MNGISFKNLNLFKNSEKHPKNGKHNSTPPEPTEQISTWKKVLHSPFLYLFITVFILASFLAYLPSTSLPIPNEGDIASSDIIAQVNLTIEDVETTEKRRNEAVRNIPPVYSFDTNVFTLTQERIREFFNFGRLTFEEQITYQLIADFQKELVDNYDIQIPSRDLNSLIRNKFPKGTEDSLISLVGKVSQQGVIVSRDLFIYGEKEKGIILFRGLDDERPLNVDNLLDMKEAKESLTVEINSLEISQGEKTILNTLSHAFIKQNINYDAVKTQERQDRVRAGVEPHFYNIKKGKVIVRKGDEVTTEALKEIQIINENLSAQPSWLLNFAGTFILLTLLLATSWYYLKSLHTERRALRYFKMVGLILVLSLLFYKLSLFLTDTFSANAGMRMFQSTESYWYAFPYQMGSIIFAFLTTYPVALIYTVINSLLVGYLLGPDFYLMVFSLVGGFAAVYGVKYYGNQKRTAPFQAGLFVIAPVNVIVTITAHMIRERMGAVDVFTMEIFMGIIGGILSAALAFLFLPVLETMFSFVTQSKLLELSNSDLPIFKQMALEAPGTYHHSLIVASLASEAAKEINLDPMLVKTGALYHDIGKVKRPEYFIENRTRNGDMHRDLKPSMSTLVIINHVKEGVELAKKLRLPRRIRNIIEQHHGNSLVRYFFEKAKAEYDPEMQKIGEESYRYPGPPPQTRESALVMLADSIEAAARSLKKVTEANLKKLITDIFNAHMEDGQLDECDFSLKELRAIASSFLAALYSIYHPRVEYPGFDFEMKNAKKQDRSKTSNDRNHKSAKKIPDQQK